MWLSIVLFLPAAMCAAGSSLQGKQQNMQVSDTSKTKNQLQGFEDFVRTIIEYWKVPGVAVAIIKDGEIVHSQGYGLRNVAEGLQVTPETLFPIASCTKAFTSTSMALLADEGKLDWDTPVKEYIPSFKLYDSFATERLTPRDLVTHRSGLPRHDLMWYHSTYTRKELFDRLQYLEPSKDLRTLWQYQNLMYMAAGYLVGELSGQSWEEFAQKRIFRASWHDKQPLLHRRGERKTELLPSLSGKEGRGA